MKPTMTIRMFVLAVLGSSALLGAAGCAEPAGPQAQVKPSGAPLVKGKDLPSSTDGQGKITPAYDVTGLWMTKDGTHAVYQQGMDVRIILDNEYYGHFFVGEYTSPTTFSGVLYRRDLATKCLTKMSVKYEVLSNDRIHLEWVGLDSACDLSTGQGGSEDMQRVTGYRVYPPKD